MVSKLDAAYRSILLSKFFVRGWGKPEDLKKIIELRRALAKGVIPPVDLKKYSVTINKEEKIHKDHIILEGSFPSPFQDFAPEILPEPVKTCHFQAILPRRNVSSGRIPLVVHYAGTGDHFYWRRRNLMALPLLRDGGIASIIIENPFYGVRKPAQQKRSSLRNVTDLLAMGGCLMMESPILYALAEDEWGFWPIVSHGISLGSHMAALGASNWNRPIGLVPCMSCTSASWTFTSGVMTEALPWDLLEEQYHREARYKDEVFNLVYPNEEALKSVLSQYPPCITPSKGSKLLSLWKEKSKKDEECHIKKESAIAFMRGILDECTHFRNHSSPVDTSLIIIVGAEIDAYQPIDGAVGFENIWPGAEMRYIKDQGHVQSYLFNQADFRRAIYDVINKMIVKYGDENTSSVD